MTEQDRQTRDDTARRMTAVDFAIRALGSDEIQDADKVVAAAKKIDAFLKGEDKAAQQAVEG